MPDNSTYHRRDPLAARSAKPRRLHNVPKGHLDADELCWRLYAVQAQQRRQDEVQSRHRATFPNAGERPKDGDALTTLRRVGKGLPVEPRSDSSRPLAKASCLSSGNLITELRRLKSARLALDRTSRASLHGRIPGNGQDTLDAYRHTPQEAAEQFTRTTTIDGTRERRLVHNLSRAALEYHLEGVRIDRSALGDPGLTPAVQARVLREDQRYRQRLWNRNQFQCNQIIEEAAKQDERREQEESRYPPNFKGELAKLKVKKSCLRLEVHDLSHDRRRNNTIETAAALFAGPPAQSTSAMSEPRIGVVQNVVHRADWEQVEEVSRRSSFLPPILSKTSSIWTLKAFRTSIGEVKCYPPENRQLSPNQAYSVD